MEYLKISSGLINIRFSQTGSLACLFVDNYFRSPYRFHRMVYLFLGWAWWSIRDFLGAHTASTRREIEMGAKKWKSWYLCSMIFCLSPLAIMHVSQRYFLDGVMFHAWWGCVLQKPFSSFFSTQMRSTWNWNRMWTCKCGCASLWETCDAHFWTLIGRRCSRERL